MVKEKKIVLCWIFIGITLRLIFMPFTLHPDILHIYYHPYFLAFKSIWNIYSYHADFFEKYVCYYYPPLTYLFFGFYLYLIKPFLNGFDKFMERIAMVNYSGGGHSGHYLISAGVEKLPRFLFLMKLPYLFFDIILLSVMFKFVSGDDYGELKKRNLLSKWWALNPLIIYISYLFGQFDIIPTFLITLAAYLAFSKKRALAMIALGTGGAFKSFPIFLILPFSFYFGREIKGIAKYAFIGIMAFIIIVGPYYISSSGKVINAFFSERISGRLGFADTPGIMRFSIFILGYIVLCLNLLKGSMRERMGMLGPVRVSFLTLGLLFISFPVSFHYFLWLTPLIIILGCKLNFKIMKIYLLAIFFLALATFAGKGMGFGLFSPIYPEFFMGLPGFDEIITNFLPYKLIKDIAAFAFAGTIVWMSILILRTADK